MRVGPGWPEGEVVGRDGEIAALERAHAHLAERSVATFVVGDPGMGKSALWNVAVDQARAAGCIVLVARPAEAEHGAPWAGLADLLAQVPPPILDALAPPQRNAVEAVCLRAEPIGGHIDPRAVWTAMRSVVLALADQNPVLLAIDDLHWLDVASVRSLESLCRRLPDRGVGVFGTLRPVGAGPVRDLVGMRDSERLELAPLSLTDIAEAVRRHLGVVLSGPALERVHTAAGGNPMFAIELTRAESHRAGRPPAVPPSLRELVTSRVEATSLEAHVTLAALAAARVTSAQLAVAGLDGGLAEAERADLARIDGSWALPSHPLVGAAAYAACDATTRRHIHARLAEVVESDHQRARHAALGTANPGPEVLAALERAATAAAARGAPDAAAELAALTLELTPPDDPARLARHLATGEHHFRSGDSAIALHHFRLVLDEAPEAAVRARAAIRLAELSWETESAEAAASHAELACSLSVGMPELNAEAEVTLSRVLSVVDLEDSAAAAARALAVLEGMGDRADRELLAATLSAGAEADFEIGRGLDRARLERAAALEHDAPPARVADRAGAALASMLKIADDLNGSRLGLAALRDAIRREGDESSLPFVLGHTVQLEIWAGRWDDAQLAAEQHLALAERTGQEAQRRQADYNIAFVAAHRGDEARAEHIASQLAAEGRADGDTWTEMIAENILGFVASARNDHDRAVEHFDISYGIAEGMSLREPGRTRSRIDYIESLIALGERKRAEALLEEYEERALAVDRASALGAAARCRALLEASTGDLDAALVAATQSLREYGRDERGSFVFDRARTLLVMGRIHRRRRQKRESRMALVEARDVFHRLGAARFVEHADGELARLGVRPQKASDLTPTERRVAELAAQGLTTRQVADAAFLSPKTVEANLTRVYRKLGVKSRAELGAWLAHQSGAG